MNFLAHLYLAAPDPALMFGGILADFVRGRAVNDYAEPVRQGIRLHVRIDSFTDSHPLVESARKRFPPPFRRYAGILIDLAFDHFLAAAWDSYSPSISLERFAAQSYKTLESYPAAGPEQMHQALAAMRLENWLVSYRSLPGTDNALRRLSRRLRHGNPLASGGGEIRRQYETLRSDFQRFHPDLVRYVTLARRALPIDPIGAPERDQDSQAPAQTYRIPAVRVE